MISKSSSLKDDLQHFQVVASRAGWRAFGRDLLFRLAGAPDRLPLPSPFLISLVSNYLDSRRFFEYGLVHARWMLDSLRAAGAQPERFAAVLEWGCGCGRLLRHVRHLTPAVLHAADCNPAHIRWLQRKLPFVHSRRNKLLPPLDYAGDPFDLVYAFSVFTHLDAATQRSWLAEIARILRPGGFCYFTTHGELYHAALRPDEQAELAASGLLARRDAPEGRNPWAAFRTRAFTAGALPAALQLLRFEQGQPEPGLPHDAYVVRKKA